MQHRTTKHHNIPCADYLHRHIAHQAALLQVMVARAAAALAQREVGHARYIEQTARQKAGKRGKALTIAELVEKFGGSECSSYDTHRAAATVQYARAFTLYPPLRETLQTDPEHDPALFPNPP